MTDLLVANQLAQPPTFDLHYFDEDQRAGWVTTHAFGFRGFETEEEAMHAAYLAHRALDHRIARRDGRRPIPVTTEPLSLRGDGTLHAAGRHIGAIVRPGPESRSGPDSFGFELPFPEPLAEVTARAKCAHVYRALRRSGIRWSMWRAAPRVKPPVVTPVERGKPVEQQPEMPWIPWWLGTLGMAFALLVMAALTPDERLAPVLAGLALAGLMMVRLGVTPLKRPYALVKTTASRSSAGTSAS